MVDCCGDENSEHNEPWTTAAGGQRERDELRLSAIFARATTTDELKNAIMLSIYPTSRSRTLQPRKLSRLFRKWPITIKHTEIPRAIGHSPGIASWAFGLIRFGIRPGRPQEGDGTRSHPVVRSCGVMALDQVRGQLFRALAADADGWGPSSLRGPPATADIVRRVQNLTSKEGPRHASEVAGLLLVCIVMVGGSTTFAEAWAPPPPPPRRRVSTPRRWSNLIEFHLLAPAGSG